MSDETLEAADIQEILEAAAASLSVSDGRPRHRRCAATRSRIGIKNVTVNEPHFTGHFPGQSGFARRADDRRHGADRGRALHLRSRRRRTGRSVVYFMTIDKAKFRKPARAGRHDRISHRQDRAAHEHVVVSRRSEGRRASSSPRPKSAPCCPRNEMPAIDPTARVAPTARVIGDDVEIGPYCVIGPHVAIGDGCGLSRMCNVTGAHHDRRGHDRLSVRLARHAAAIGALSRRADAARHRRALPDPRRRHDEYRHRGRRRHHAGRRRAASSWSARMSGTIATSATT